MKVGDKIKIRNKNEVFALKHRKTRNGVITNINGSYILVRPMWCKWEVELYLCEIKLLK